MTEPTEATEAIGRAGKATPASPSDLAALVAHLQGRRILVAGDIVADVYIDGRISRISREAPVLVLEQAAEKIIAGGAANVVHNCATLGGCVTAIGLVGDDKEAQGVRAILTDAGVDTTGLVCDPARPTISKTRIIAGGRATVSQQIVRLDRESHDPVSRDTEARLLHAIDAALPGTDAIVLSDYGSGTITDRVKERLITYARRHDIPSIVDSRYDIHRFADIGYVKQNDSELAAAAGRRLRSADDIVEAAKNLLLELRADGVLVTRGERGMILALKDGAVHDIPVTDKSEVYDVSGAGDTCVSTLILALAAGIPPATAARLSNYASGIAVRKLGTATVSATELQRAIEKS